ncbi:MAG: myxococcus cysteine-rich repeat containing protein [Nannocystaceae bacterium]
MLASVVPRARRGAARRSVPLALCAALACAGGSGASESDASGDASTTTASTTTTTTTGPTTTVDPTEMTITTTETTQTTEATIDPTETTTVGPAECGNGIIEPGESCDDGNQVGGDGCEADCTLLAGGEWWRETVDGGDSGLDKGYGVATDAAGNIYIVATVADPLAKSDIFIRKYDAIGVSVWTRNYDGGAAQNDVGVAITGDASGFMIVAGRQTPQGELTTAPWLSKCDPNGQILWQTLGDPAENFAALAMFSASHFVGGGTIKEGMDTNALLRRFDDGGGEVWSATHAGADGGPDAIAAVAVDGAGDIFVVGREFTQATSFDAWVARYSAGGDELWSFTVDGPASGPDWGTAIAAHDDGWIVVGGRQDFGGGEGADAWIARYTSAGDEVWTQLLNGPASGDDAVHGLAIDGAGAIVAVGHQAVAGQGLDAWIQKLDGDGAELWTRTIDGDGSGDDEAAAVAVDSEDNAVTVGTVAVIQDFDTDVLLIKHAP